MTCKLRQYHPTLAIELKGGFGNQLFQFSTVVAAAIQSEACFKLTYANGSRKFVLESLGLHLGKRYFPSILDGGLKIEEVPNHFILGAKEFREKSLDFEPIPVFRNNALLKGYFQSFRYFDVIRKELVDWINARLPEVSSKHYPEIMIHVRLGDFARNRHFREFHGVTPSDYFIRGIESFGGRDSSIEAITDDLELFPLEHKDLLENFPQIQVLSGEMIKDFSYLTKSKNLIISNSTFSWWAAYLSSASVIAPSKWFANNDSPFHVENFYPVNWRVLR